MIDAYVGPLMDAYLAELERGTRDRIFILHRTAEQSLQKLYGFSGPDRAVEVVTLRVRATLAVPKPDLNVRAPARTRNQPSRRRIRVDGKWREVPVFQREQVGSPDPRWWPTTGPPRGFPPAGRSKWTAAPI